MAVRVDQLVPYGYTDTAIATFHAFGDRLIREYALELGLPTDVRVLSRPEVVIFLREHLFEFDLDAYRPLGDPTRFLAALATLFSRCKDEDISPADVPRPRRPGRGRGGEPRRGGSGGRHGIRGRRGATDAALEEAGARPSWRGAYATLPGAARRQRLHRLRRPGRARAAARARVGRPPGPTIAGRFRYILVDEFQDTNRAQAELVALLAEGHRNVTVVGDDDQAIYAFRGAAIDNILGFRDRYRAARTVVLRRNYRSLAPILDAAYRLVRFNDPDRLEVRAGIGKRLRAERADARRRAGPARGVRDGIGGGRLDRRRDRPPDRGRAAAARPRRPRPRQRPRRPDPARARTWPASRGGSRARPACTPGPRSGCCWRSCGPSPTRRLERGRVRPRGLGGVRPRWRGPDGDRQHGPPAEPVGLGDPRGARPPARHPAGRRRRRATAVRQARRGPARLRRARPRAAGRRGAVPVPARQRHAGPARGHRHASPPRRRSPTSPGSSRSSAPSRRCWPTTGRCSSRATSRR